MNQFRARLTFIMMAIIGATMVVAGLFIAKLLEQSHIDLLRGNMMRELKVVAVEGDWGKLTGSDPELIGAYSKEAVMLKNLANTRITYVREDGKVLGDSDQDPAAMDNHHDRPEIAEARTSGFGDAIRFSDTLKKNMLYVAMRLDDPEPRRRLFAAGDELGGRRRDGPASMVFSRNRLDRALRARRVRLVPDRSRAHPSD